MVFGNRTQENSDRCRMKPRPAAALAMVRAARNGFASNSSWSLWRSNIDARTLEKKSVSSVAVLAKAWRKYA